MRELGLKAISGTFDEPKAEAIAASQGLNLVVSGSIDRRGSDYQLSLRAVQTVTGKVLATADATAPNKDQVLFAVTKLGTTIRKALGDATSDSEQRLSMETLSAGNLEAVHEYASGLDTLSAGKFADAQSASFAGRGTRPQLRHGLHDHGQRGSQPGPVSGCRAVHPRRHQTHAAA